MPAHVCLIRHRDYGELSLRREAEALAHAGYQVHVICLRSADGTDEEGADEPTDGVRVHAVPLERERGGPLRYVLDYSVFFLAAAALVSWLHVRHRFAVVQVNTMPDFLVFCAAIPKLLGARVVVFMKEPTPELGTTKLGSPRTVRILEWLEQAALRFADLALTVTEQLKQTYVARGADPDKIRVVLNGPDARHLAGAAVEDRSSREGSGRGSALDEDARPGRFTVLCHGAIEERYGHETLVRAVGLARTVVPGLRCRITGEGRDVDRIRSLVRDLGLEEHVQILGWVPLTVLRDELCRADVGVVAQESSPYSNLVHTNKMYDYILFEKPVIATRLAAVGAYFDDRSLCFVEPGDAHAMARAIVELARDPERRDELRANASRLYRDYGWDAQSSIYLGAYDELVGA